MESKIPKLFPASSTLVTCSKRKRVLIAPSFFWY